MTPVMNTTKWDELRVAMLEIDPPPLWSTLSLNGHKSRPDREWFYHFRDEGYADIVSVEITADTPAHRGLILAALQKIHLPGEQTEGGFRVFGYVSAGQAVDYL